MNAMRAYLSAILVAALVLTGHSMAIARGMPGAAGWMELCTGTGPVMVAMDADGQPTGESHICPDFSLSLLDHVAPTEAVAPPVALRFTTILSAPAPRSEGLTPRTAKARGPPAIL
ncbi:hypothetical protein [Shimia biformata]|uniref:hypothetical protein n=1 Tax=Shimia biformata TaxID=1294299 RepID=UPI001EF198D0|nr:hypothetical protein [Shimia biformata]